jgi:hypothetical protein
VQEAVEAWKRLIGPLPGNLKKLIGWEL